MTLPSPTRPDPGQPETTHGRPRLTVDPHAAAGSRPWRTALREDEQRCLEAVVVKDWPTAAGYASNVLQILIAHELPGMQIWTERKDLYEYNASVEAGWQTEESAVSSSLAGPGAAAPLRLALDAVITKLEKPPAKGADPLHTVIGGNHDPFGCPTCRILGWLYDVRRGVVPE